MASRSLRSGGRIGTRSSAAAAVEEPPPGPDSAAAYEQVASSAGGESGDGESDSESSSSIEAPPLNVTSRASRSTAGKNTRVLEGKALEDDGTFWGHEGFKEGSSDSDVNFAAEAVAKSDDDSSDSDFDAEQEPEAQKVTGEARDGAEEDRAPRRKRLLPPGRVVAKRLARVARPTMKRAAKSQQELPPVTRTIRESTKQRRVAVEERVAQGEEEAAKRPSRRQRAAPLVLTQQERLEEASRTEVRSLAELRALRNTEELLRRQGRHERRRVCRGPKVVFRSKLAPGAQRLLGSHPGVECSVTFVGCELPGVLQGAGGERSAQAVSIGFRSQRLDSAGAGLPAPPPTL